MSLNNDEFTAPLLEENTELLSRKSKYIIGILCVAFYELNEITQSQYTQWQYSNLVFNDYYFLTWFSTIFLSLTFPIFLLLDFTIKYTRRQPGKDFFLSYKQHVHHQLFLETPFNWRFIIYATILSQLNFWSSYLWYFSVGNIPNALNFALSHSEVIFVFILSRVVLKEQLTKHKILTLCVLMGGMLCIGIGKEDSRMFTAEQVITGICIALGATLLWSIYEIGFKKWFGTPNLYFFMFLQTVMGISVIMSGALFIPIFNFTNREPLSQLTLVDWQFLWISVGFAVTYYIAYAAALVCTTPIWISFLGLVSLPITALSDYMLWDDTYKLITVLGMCILIVTLIVYNVYEIYFVKEKPADVKDEAM